MSFKKWALLAAALLLPIAAYAEMNGEANPTQPYLNISGNNQLDGVSVNPNTAAAGNFTTLTASGVATLNGTTTFNSASVFASAATHNNTTTFNSAVTVANTATFTSGAVFSSPITNSSTETQNGAATFNNTATFNSAVSIANTATFTSVPTFSSAMTIANTATFSSGAVFNSSITSIDTHYAVAGTTLIGNPLEQVTVQNITLASVNAGTPILASVSGRTIYVRDLTIMASGTAAGGTSVIINCGLAGVGGTVATFPIAALVSLTPVSPFFNSGAITKGSALAQGCGSGNALMISAVGTLTTSSNFFLVVPYIVQ
jgi:hypothetical protein